MATYANNVENAVLSGLFTSLSGNSIANSLVGNAAANSLSGVAGNDTLIEFAGNDTLNGGTDADSMVGGLDNDYYLVDNLSDSILELSSQGIDSVAGSVKTDWPAIHRSQVTPAMSTTPSCTALIAITRTGHERTFGSGQPGNKRSITMHAIPTPKIHPSIAVSSSQLVDDTVRPRH
jgi:hypothetical protein